MNPILINELLHVGGRLTKAPLRHDNKHPLILPSTHHIADMIIRVCHERVSHKEREHVLSSLRAVLSKHFRLYYLFSPLLSSCAVTYPWVNKRLYLGQCK